MPPRKPVKPRIETRTEPIPEPARSGRSTKGSDKISRPDSSIQIAKFLKDEKTHIVAGIVLSLITIYLLTSLVSYFFHGAADQSKMHLDWSELQQSRTEIQNVTSVSGALFSHQIIHNGFGLGAFALIFMLVVISLRFMKFKIMSVWKAFFHASFWLVWLSTAMGFVNLHFQPLTFFALGGAHGDFVSAWISSYFGDMGNLLTIGGSLLIYAIISFAAALPAIKNMLAKKQKNEIVDTEDEDLGRSVAVGTELVPEDWITNNKNEEDENIEEEDDDIFEPKEEEMIEDEETEDEITEDKNSEVGFEIAQPVMKEENLPVDASENNTSEENDDPTYSLDKLGKYDPTLDLSRYQYPTLNLLKVYGTDNETQIDMKEQTANKNRITQTLQNYGIEIKNIKATVGPTITLYEIVPKDGVRISKIRNLESDIMLSLAATGIRIIAPIPGKGTIGIEVPNSDPQVVSMHSVIASKKFQESKFELPVAFGRTITNEIFMVDLTKMPHLLVAGATGQGKSVGLNAIITSLLYKKHPSELKLVLIDPKKVEFNIYSDIEKHFLAKLPDGEDAIITDTTKVVETLSSLCREMDERYDLLKKAHARNIKEYNEKFVNRQLNPEKGHKFLPYIVVIVDEFGDLIMTAGKEVELPIARIAQLARAIGIHMIIATQRPSVNIITGVIKANFPARVAFRVSSQIDSRTIIDAPGANQLVGRGDMLFTQGNELSRVQCAFVDTPEVENVVHYIGDQQSYPTAFYLPEYIGNDADAVDVSSVDMSKRDPLFDDAARLIVANQQGSTSLIQRKFSIGYNRAGRIVDQLEVAGIIGPFEGSKARQVLVMDDYHLEQILKQLN